MSDRTGKRLESKETDGLSGRRRGRGAVILVMMSGRRMVKERSGRISGDVREQQEDESGGVEGGNQVQDLLEMERDCDWCIGHGLTETTHNQLQESLSKKSKLRERGRDDEEQETLR
jgi:hypothetical protein